MWSFFKSVTVSTINAHTIHKTPPLYWRRDRTLKYLKTNKLRFCNLGELILLRHYSEYWTYLLKQVNNNLELTQLYFTHYKVITVTWHIVSLSHSVLISFYTLPFLPRWICEQFYLPSTSITPFSTAVDFISVSKNFRDTNPVFDPMQPGTVTLVIMGLDHWIGHIPTECSSVRDW